MDVAVLVAEVPAVIQDFGLGTAARVDPVAGGSLNWNFDVRTGDGRRLFVRRYRDNLETERIAGEHELLEWVAGRRIPVARPLERQAGSTILERGAARWSVFPWIEGNAPVRGAMAAPQVRELGAMHGRVQSVLKEHPLSSGAVMQLEWSREHSLKLLEKLIRLAEERPVESWILEGLREHYEMLAGYDVISPSAFAGLPCQLLHGDFHDQQVLFAGDEVVAVVDWEIWHADARAWELVRSIAFSRILDSAMMEPYLEGYREHVRLSESECRLALRLWWQTRVVGLWAWAAYFLEGNQRVAAFFPEMIGTLRKLRDDSWRERIEGRFLRAAVG